MNVAGVGLRGGWRNTPASSFALLAEPLAGWTAAVCNSSLITGRASGSTPVVRTEQIDGDERGRLRPAEVIEVQDAQTGGFVECVAGIET